MKIIAVDNFANEAVEDELIAENVDEYYGKKIVGLLNLINHDYGGKYFRLVEDNYRLWRGIEDLV